MVTAFPNRVAIEPAPSTIVKLVPTGLYPVATTMLSVAPARFTESAVGFKDTRESKSVSPLIRTSKVEAASSVTVLVSSAVSVPVVDSPPGRTVPPTDATAALVVPVPLKRPATATSTVAAVNALLRMTVPLSMSRVPAKFVVAVLSKMTVPSPIVRIPEPVPVTVPVTVKVCPAPTSKRLSPAVASFAVSVPE